MFRRRSGLEVCPKTTVHEFYRSDAFFVALLPIVLLLLLFLPSCQSNRHSVSVKFYKTLQDCLADRVPPQRCRDALAQAKQEHLQNQLTYPSKVVCEQNTQSPCEAISTSQRLVYKPIVQGFAVEQPVRGSSHSGGHGGSFGHAVYVQGATYRLANREPLRFSHDGTATVNTRRSITRGFGSSFRSSRGYSSGS